MIQIIGTRQTGRTTQLIRLCKRLNDENGYNDTVILTSSKLKAEFIMILAKEIGCGDIPFPISSARFIQQRGALCGTLYRRVLVDDMEYVMQQILSQCVMSPPLELAGYSIQGPEMTTEFGVRSWISEREVIP